MNIYRSTQCTTCDEDIFVPDPQYPICPELADICEECARYFLEACGLELCHRCGYRLTDAREFILHDGGSHWYTCGECRADFGMYLHFGGFSVNPNHIGPGV